MSTQPFPKETPKHGRNSFIFIGGIILLFAVTAFILFSGYLSGTGTAVETTSSNIQLPTSGDPLTVGDTAYEFQLSNLEGEIVNLSDHLGHPVIVNFWASWCAPCRIEMPELQAVYDNYQDQGLVILAINQAETAKTASSFFFDQMGLTFTNPLLDEDTLTAQNYGVFNLPTTYFINAEGVVTAIHRGPAVESQLEGYLAETIPHN